MPVAHKSAISVGLLYIPVGMYKTTRNASISFNQLCKDSKERIRYKKYCPSCDKEIKNEDIVKGYEYEKGKYVTFTSDELEKIKTKKDKTIHVEYFAKMSEIDSILFDKNYYMVPESGAEKAYELLRRKDGHRHQRKSAGSISHEGMSDCQNSILPGRNTGTAEVPGKSRSDKTGAGYGKNLD